MQIEQLSEIFHVRGLNNEDIDQIYDLSCRNTIFYQYHPPFVTRESILEDMRALPSGKNEDDKFYIGFFQREKLVAVMDLILDYPEKHIAFIGLFMMNMEYQGQGIGSKIIQESLTYLKKLGYRSSRLGVDQNNPQSYAFWNKNGFKVISKDEYIRMEKDL